jgi:hypothetical protein
MIFFHSCNSKNIFIRWKLEFSIPLDCHLVEGKFHLSPHQNIFSIALINIHYLCTIYLAGFVAVFEILESLELNKFEFRSLKSLWIVWKSEESL